MVDSISGYRSTIAIKPMSSESTQSVAQENDKPANTGGILGYVLEGDQDTRAPEEKVENKQGPIGGLLSGIVNGFKGTLEGLFSLKGLLMVGAFIALTALTGGALGPILVALGLGVGGFQVTKGVVTGDWEQAGRGLFTLGTTALGARFDFKTAKHFQSGERFSLALSKTQSSGAQAASKFRPSFMDNIKLTLGKKMTTPSGAQKNIYQLAGSNVKHWFA